jgi:hypothetical protein
MTARSASEASLQDVLDVLAITPCHITGMHEPEHHLRYLCSTQKAELLDKVLAVLGLAFKGLPHRLHDECGWCHRVPAQEEYRERLRQTWEWAGVPLTDELRAPAPDVPSPDDVEVVYAALTDEFETWQVVLPRVHVSGLSHFPVGRYWSAIRTLGDRVETRDISVRRRQPTATADEDAPGGAA